MSAPPSACPACAGARFALAVRVPGGAVWRCAGCGLGASVPPPAGADGHEPFADDAAYFRRAVEQPKDRWWRRFNDAPLELLARAGAGRGLALLDVGCNVGYLVAAARGRGFRARGVDASPAAVAVGRAALAVDLECARIDAARIAPGSQDVVVLNHVLEHLPDPARALDAAREWLRPGGFLLVGLPNFASPLARRAAGAWAGLVPEQHVWHFTPAALRRLVLAAGFGAVRWRTVMLTYAPQGAAGWAKWLVRRALEPLRLADNLLLVARRPPAAGAA